VKGRIYVSTCTNAQLKFGSVMQLDVGEKRGAHAMPDCRLNVKLRVGEAGYVGKESEHVLLTWYTIGYERRTYRRHEREGRAHAARGLHDDC
jgi:hypothetical protein